MVCVHFYLLCITGCHTDSQQLGTEVKGVMGETAKKRGEAEGRDNPADNPAPRKHNGSRTKRANWTPEEAREYGAKGGRIGGVRSGESKRRKKLYRERAQAILDAMATPKMQQQIAKVLGESGEDDTVYDAVVARLVAKALKGDVAASRELTRMAEGIDSAKRQDGPNQSDGLSDALRGIAAGIDAARQDC